MGNWTIVIEGTGCHHNDADYDADRMVSDFVDNLQCKGHVIDHASFTAGGRHDTIAKLDSMKHEKGVDERQRASAPLSLQR